MSQLPLIASLDGEEAVLRFSYDERLRRLLRAIPGRRWDPLERAWRVPLGPDQARSLALILDGLPLRAQLSRSLSRALERRGARRRREPSVIDVCRPDERWWLTCATDAPEQVVEALLEHRDARRVHAIGSVLAPLDERGAGIAHALLRTKGDRVRLSDDAGRALRELARAREREQESTSRGRADARRHDVELVRDRRGEHWVLIARERADLARVLAARAGLRALDGPDGTFGLAAVEHDAQAIATVLGHLEDVTVDPRVTAWLTRMTRWRGNVEVERSADGPVFLLLGDERRLPRALRERAESVDGGVRVAMTLECWRLVAGLDAWIGPAVRRCVAALEEGRPPPPAVLERSSDEEEPAFVLAPGHEPALLDAFAALPGALGARPARSGARDKRQLASLGIHRGNSID